MPNKDVTWSDRRQDRFHVTLTSYYHRAYINACQCTVAPADGGRPHPGSDVSSKPSSSVYGWHFVRNRSELCTSGPLAASIRLADKTW